MYSMEMVRRVLALASSGMPHQRIAREEGVAARTVGRWVGGQTPKHQDVAEGPELIPPGAEQHYAYLLGLYLGDGHLARIRRVFHLRITLDAAYPGIVRECGLAMRAVRPTNRVATYRHWSGHEAMVVASYSKQWPTLFPQHGPGRKHMRVIELAAWQSAITHEHPKSLVRGLIHSDGSRFVARQRTAGQVYMYPRYSFDNRSDGIMQIFCKHLELLGVDWTMCSPESAQIARRESVAKLDRFVGPKT